MVTEAVAAVDTMKAVARVAAVAVAAVQVQVRANCDGAR